MTSKICACNNVDLPRVLQGPLEPKHYLKFPTSVDACRTDKDCKLLRHYTSCPAILAKLNAETRQKVVYQSTLSLLDTKALNKMTSSSCGEMIILQGGRESQWNYYQADTLMCVFKQEQYFRYMFGADIPDCYGVYLVRDKSFHLFVPEIPDAHRAYLGDEPSNEEIKKRWNLTSVHFVKDLKSWVEDKKPSKIYVLEGINADSGLSCGNTVDVIDIGLDSKYKKIVDKTKLYKLLDECRATKTPQELKMLQVTNYISSMAHTITMLNTFPDSEELYHEAIYKSVCTIVGGARNVAYSCICAAGVNAAILHYGHATKPNDKIVRKVDMVLHDMGGIYPCGYVSDITCSYPVSRKFTEDQKVIYQAVYDANMAVQDTGKNKTSWVEMHELAELHIAKALIKIGILKGEPEKLVKERIIAYFMPHGLGHMIGLDVHDCAGVCTVTKEQVKKLPGLRNLRLTRKLETNMFITVEPGCYFIQFLIDALKEHPEHSQYYVDGSTDKFMNMGGVRIEDNVVVTSKGIVNYTVVPRTIEEIEEFFRLNQK